MVARWHHGAALRLCRCWCLLTSRSGLAGGRYSALASFHGESAVSLAIPAWRGSGRTPRRRHGGVPAGSDSADGMALA